MKYLLSPLKIILLAVIATVLLSTSPVTARKKGYRLNVEKKSASESTDQEMTKGSFMVASQCEDCNNGYRLSQVVFTGYDKPRASATETFFITNNTDRVLTGANLYIEYLTLDGRQLHKRFYPLRCNIPPGETRQASLPSWDKNKSFVYEKSRDNERHPGTPFTVIFEPIDYYLRF